MNGVYNKQFVCTAPPSPLTASLSLLEAKEGFGQIVAEELTKLVRTSRQEAGCLFFDLYRISGKHSAFALYEVWEQREAMHAHLCNIHTSRCNLAVEPYLAGPIQVFEFEELL